MHDNYEPAGRMTSSEKFHQDFEAVSQPILEDVMEALLEGPGECTREAFIGQLLMNMLGDDQDVDATCTGKFTVEQKVMLTKLADHMGPDWAQALYHASVFITRVA